MGKWSVFIFAFVIYAISIFGGFVQDDLVVVSGDPGMGKVESLMLAWSRPYYYMQGSEFSVYRPVTSFSFYVNSLVSGTGAWGFRLGNVILYGIVCVLVFELLSKMENLYGPAVAGDKRSCLAFWGAIIFAALPIHTEVVNNIVGRGEMLSLIFVILAIIANFKKRWDLSALYLFLGLMSKETAIVGVPILIYLIIQKDKVENLYGSPIRSGMTSVFTGKEKREEVVAAVFFVMMALVGFVAIRSVVLGGFGTSNNATMVENPLKFVSTSQRVINGIALIPLGVSKIIFPVNLSYDYSFNQLKLIDNWFDWRVMLGILMMIISLVVLWNAWMDSRLRGNDTIGLLCFPPIESGAKGWGRNDGIVMGMMFFWVPVLVTGNILFPVGTIFGERLWFLPSLGMVMILLSGIHWMDSPQEYRGSLTALRGNDKNVKENRLGDLNGFRVKSGMTIIMVIVILYAGRTLVRNFDWLSQQRLFLHDSKYATGSVMAQSNAAAMYMMNNDPEIGMDYLERADKIYPKYPELLNNWGVYYLRKNEFDKAEKKFEECLKERPGYELCKGNLEDMITLTGKK